MFLKTFTLALTLCFTWVNYVCGAPYSNVYLQSGPEVLPVEYFQYGSPSFPIVGEPYAQLSAAPAGSNLVPVSTVPVSSVSSYISPCGSSCIYPGQGVAPISQFASAPANLVAYNSPISSVPVVVPREDTGYQYSYVVYDEHTGDHKAQREHSDGSVVRGEYSFVQPDGYVREVQYVADDLNGFNAIVKNYLPASVGEVKVVEHIEKKIPVPCIEVKNEPFVEVQEIIEPDTHEAVIELITSHHLEHAHHVPSEEVHHHENSVEPHHTEESHHSDSDVTESRHSEEHHDHTEETHGHPEETHLGHTEESNHDQHGYSEETQRNHPDEHHIEVVEIVDCANGQVHHSNHEESLNNNVHLEESQHAHSEEKDAESSEDKDDEKESIEEHDGHSESHHEPEERTHSHTEVVLIEEEDHPEHTETADHTEHGESNTQVSYEKVINCVHTAVEEAKEASSTHKADTSSPTYIILNKPC